MITPSANSTDRPQGSSPSEEEFVRLFMQFQRILFAYLRTTLGNSIDAEEVLQETSVILWRDRHQFVLGTNFLGWAITVAHNQVHKFRRKRKHKPESLSEELLDQIAMGMVAQSDLADSRHRALQRCKETLSDQDRFLLNAAYGVKATMKSASERLGMTPNVFYKALNRIRQRLLKCIKYRLMAEERA